jgi:hypothetical protein
VDSFNEDNSDIRETTLSMLTRILDQKKNVNVVLDAKEYLIDLGIKCINILRRFDGEEKQMVEEELRLWELLISQLAKAVRDEVTSFHEKRPRESALIPMNIINRSFSSSCNYLPRTYKRNFESSESSLVTDHSLTF